MKKGVKVQQRGSIKNLFIFFVSRIFPAYEYVSAMVETTREAIFSRRAKVMLVWHRDIVRVDLTKFVCRSWLDKFPVKGEIAVMEKSGLLRETFDKIFHERKSSVKQENKQSS